MDTETLIELNNVNVAHAEDNERVLIREVNWTIQRGEFWIIGSSGGGGISSLLTTAAGLNRPQSGTVRLGALDAMAATEADRIEWRRRVGFVFEGGGRLLSTLTLAENIALPLEYNTAMTEAEIDEHVAKLLDRVGLSAHAHTPMARITPHWQQRAGFARATVLPREILFVDKPPAGRETRDARWWHEALCEQHKQGVTIIVGTNDFAAWLDVANHFALVREERFATLRSSDEVLAATDETLRELLMVK